MRANISELDLGRFSIRKGSIVELNFHGTGSGMRVEVEKIYSENGNITIESSSTSYCLPNFTHDAGQYEESGKLIKY